MGQPSCVPWCYIDLSSSSYRATGAFHAISFNVKSMERFITETAPWSSQPWESNVMAWNSLKKPLKPCVTCPDHQTFGAISLKNIWFQAEYWPKISTPKFWFWCALHTLHCCFGFYDPSLRQTVAFSEDLHWNTALWFPLLKTCLFNN